VYEKKGGNAPASPASPARSLGTVVSNAEHMQEVFRTSCSRADRQWMWEAKPTSFRVGRLRNSRSRVMDL